MVTLTRVLVATDFSDPADNAVRYGQALSRAFGATLDILHVADDLAARMISTAALPLDLDRFQHELEEEAGRRLDGLVSEQDREAGRERTVIVTSSYPAHAITSYARDNGVNLIVIGTHGRKGVQHFLMGSVAERVVRTSPCPVLIVRSPEREFVRPDALEVVSHAGAEQQG